MDSLAEKTCYVLEFIQSQQKLYTFKETFVLQENFITGIFNFVGEKGFAWLSRYLEPLVFNFVLKFLSPYTICSFYF